MKLFAVSHAGEHSVVKALDMADAVGVWRLCMGNEVEDGPDQITEIVEVSEIMERPPRNQG